MAFRLGNLDGRAVLIDGENWHDLAAVSNGSFSGDPMEAVHRHAELHTIQLNSRSPDGAVASAVFGPPVPCPRSVFAIGLNYAGHAGEADMDLPESPLVFTKFPSCLAGATDNVELNSDFADYEAELVVVIGTAGRSISPNNAWNHVMGLTVGQDISDRALQFAAKPPHFDLGKSRDTYGPCGPAVVSTDLIAEPSNLRITCDINGERRQSSNTGQLIFDVPTLISYLSEILTLEVGDLIFTGTPEGIGASSGEFLAAGDVIETSIEGLGKLRNVCI
ncbi:MAG: fumarylacetoacetate hydrolase [Halieaceae bacterium]|nr:fumarylacetoacetate hydrolase [Halieaceae bacterium]